ncbi:MAG: type II toxin-antitoxin system HicA family toxin [Sulfurimicrobium sp.]|nr:type II toxin-antitoxin system HicA family toxin [Sulfurimicrobium sp.]
MAVGCNVVEGSGSSVTFEKDGRRAYFHRPHPQRESLIYRVKAAREFLMKLEITP